MKGLTAGMMAFIAIVVLLAVTGFGLIPGSIFPTAEIVTIDGKSCELIRPQFGRYSCEHLGEVVNQQVVSWPQGYVNGDIYTIPNANVDFARISVYCENSYFFWYQKTNEVGCEPGSDGWCNTGVAENQIYETGIILYKGEKLRVGGCATHLQGGFPGRLYQSYNPFGLVRYSSGAKKDVINYQGCSMFYNPEVTKSCGDAPGCEADAGTTGLGRTVSLPGELIHGDWVNYLDYYVTVPKLGNVKSYKAQDVVCIPSANKVELWSIGSFETFGSCYAMPLNFVTTVDCCEGESYPGYTCVDWNLVPVTPEVVPSCITRLECTNAGGWYKDPTKNEMVREDCINGKCQIVERKTIQCTTSAECPSGYVCNLQTYACERSIPEIVCGDGVCSPPWENMQNCPEDCAKDDPITKMLGYLGIFVAAMIISGIVLGILIVVGILRWLIGNPRMLLLAWIGFAIVLTLLFSLPLAALSASIFTIGGL